jgi:hypothetical protein
MTDQECEAIYNEIIRMLQGDQFSVLVDGIMEQIAEGKIVIADVKTFKEILDEVQNVLPTLGPSHNDLRQFSTNQFPAITPYTPRERLEILIDVLEQALITPVEIENYLTKSFMPRYSLKGLAFVSHDGKQIIKIDRQNNDLQSRKHYTDSLRMDLALLRKEL